MPNRTPNRRRACTAGTLVAVITLGGLLGVAGPAAAVAADTTSGTDADVAVVGQQADPAAADTGSSGGTAADAGAASDTGAAGSGAADSGAAGTGAAGSGAAGSGAAGPDAATPADAGTAAGTPATSDPTTPAASSSPDPSDTASPSADATAVTIDGAPTVGATLTARATGFTGPVTYSWRAGDTTLAADGDSYTPTRADAGQVITVTVDSLTDDPRSASTTRVTAPPAFDDQSTPDDPVTLTTGAGERFRHAFATTGFPAPTYSVQYWDADASPEESDGDDSSFLPYGITLDHTTGVLSGTSDYAGTYAFRIVATDGTTSVSQYVHLTTTPGAPLGIEVTAEDRSTVLTAHSTSWVIERDGTVWTFQNETTRDGDGYITFGSGFEGGQPTIDQGGTLLVGGDLVDRFGNAVHADDWTPTPVTVTSDHASDVIAPDEEWTGRADVTFPQASTHRLTVSAQDFATAFNVAVRPTAVTTVRTVPTTTRTELAYTGSDALGLLPWAAGLLLGGAAITAVRGGVRRRR
ncbi:hypothetical protein JOE58_000588 [Curtobacterium luteum]|uniref:Uncharacterized protein n=1 Tax=Curtobacterium luteum TaxID=33881 RepID=A0A8H9GCJ5_9MICO|nr:putative Ig domain-containing protein [Curtobacterium luteum]MBM7801337.1 hypothetical protein [Curtobacterium luteum]NUU50016.1 hypothetical protein [Curtobacterium luteum]GGL12818.1 hypothetical protein GCM10009769_33450 [Curtobacterium luteum]